LIIKHVKTHNIIMKIFINQKEFQIFDGATVEDAVLAFDKTAHKLLVSGKLAVHDRYGHVIENDGQLTTEQYITIETTHADETN
jgi:hypothetical protein